MTAAEQEWTPGDPNPLIPDNGCGSIPTVNWTPQERQAATDEDDTPPPWWRPDGPVSNFAFTRSCAPCGVRWRGEDPCWNCGEDPAA